MKQRPITNTDIWAAARGLNMFNMSVEELDKLIEERTRETIDHYDTLFASRVILAAARQVRVVKTTGARMNPDTTTQPNLKVVE